MFIVKSRVFHVMTRTSETIPVLTQYDSCQTRDNTQNTCIHVNTHENMYWWSGINYEPVSVLVTDIVEEPAFGHLSQLTLKCTTVN